MDLGLRGARALVTGATKGLGKAVASGLLSEGAAVVACGREVSTVPARALGLRIDVTSAGAAETMVEFARSELGGLDILVAAAGQSTAGTVEDNDDERWALGLDLNLLSIVRLCRAAIPMLRQSQQARIVLFGAVSGLEPRGAHGISNIAKSGIHVLTKTLSRELAGDGILVNCIAPGRIRSAQLDRAFPDEEARRAHAQDLIPLGRFGEADEVVPLTLLLASAANTYVTGQTVAVDGGMTHAH